MILFVNKFIIHYQSGHRISKKASAKLSTEVYALAKYYPVHLDLGIFAKSRLSTDLSQSVLQQYDTKYPCS